MEQILSKSYVEVGTLVMLVMLPTRESIGS